MIAAILKPLAGLFDLVPGWLWALAVAGLALTNCATAAVSAAGRC